VRAKAAGLRSQVGPVMSDLPSPIFTNQVLTHLRQKAGDGSTDFFVDVRQADLTAVLNYAEDAYKSGFAACYAKQVIAEMKGEADNLWCDVEGCHEPPTLYDLTTKELVCREHLDYSL
jgi:hypothetical protein